LFAYHRHKSDCSGGPVIISARRAACCSTKGAMMRDARLSQVSLGNRVKRPSFLTRGEFLSALPTHLHHLFSSPSSCLILHHPLRGRPSALLLVDTPLPHSRASLRVPLLARPMGREAMSLRRSPPRPRSMSTPPSRPSERLFSNRRERGHTMSRCPPLAWRPTQ
jgi:hypothetical protein